MLEHLFEFLKQSWESVVPMFVVDAWERGIVLRFGVHVRDVGPGLHWRIPLVERPITHGVVTSVHSLTPQSVTTADGHPCVLSAVVTWRVSDVRKLLLEVEDAAHALRDACTGVLTTHASAATWASMGSDEFLEGVRVEMRRIAFRWGIEVMRVQFADRQRCRSLRLWQESRYHDA